jgi:MFS family permease
MNQQIETNRLPKHSFLSNIRLFNLNIWVNLMAWFTLQFCFAGIFAVLLNLYLTRLGYGIDFIGIVNTASGLGFALFAIPAGVLGARWGYRRMIILGLIGGAVFPALLLISQFFNQDIRGYSIIASYGLYALSMTLIAVNGVTFLANSATDASRVHVFSVYGAIAPLAGFFGSIIGGFMPKAVAGLTGASLEQAVPYSLSLWIVPILFFVFLGLFVFLTKQGQNMASQQQTGAGTDKTKVKAPVTLFMIMFLVTMLRVSSFYAIFVFFSVYLDSLKTPTTTIGMITAIGRLIPVLAALLTPLFVSRTGKFKLVILVSICSAIFVLPIGLFPDLMAAAISLIVISIANAIAAVAFTPLHQEATPVKWRSLMAGSVFCAEAVSFALMAFLGGFMIKSLGYQLFFLVSAGTTFLSAFFFWWLLKNRVARA